MRAVLVVLSAILVGCSSSPVSINEAKFTSASNYHIKSVLEDSPDKVEIWFKRDTYGFAHALYKVGVYVDGRNVGDIGSGEVLKVFLRRGSYSFGVGESGKNSQVRDSIFARVNSRNMPVYRLSIGGAGWSGWKITESVDSPGRY